MARDLYGLDAATLLQLRTDAQMELAKGMSIVSAGSGDVNTAQQVILHARIRIREINEELLALGDPNAPPDIVLPRDFTSVRVDTQVPWTPLFNPGQGSGQV